jgi:hypothetical protein
VTEYTKVLKNKCSTFWKSGIPHLLCQLQYHHKDKKDVSSFGLRCSCLFWNFLFQVFFYDVDDNTRGTAQDIAVLDSAYFLSQVILTPIVGYIEHLSGNVAAYMVCSVILGVVSCFCVLRVTYNRQEMITYLRNRRQDMIAKAKENGGTKVSVM